MLVAKLIVAICMLLGLIGTFIHKLPGTPLIFFAALLYGLLIGLSTVGLNWMVILLALMLTAELGSRYLCKRLMPEVDIGKVFGLDVAAGSFASLILTDVLAGPLLGLIIWELLIGKSLMPLLKRSGMLVLKLFVAAVFRFSIAIAMIVIVTFKVF